MNVGTSRRALETTRPPLRTKGGEPKPRTGQLSVRMGRDAESTRSKPAARFCDGFERVYELVLVCPEALAAKGAKLAKLLCRTGMRAKVIEPEQLRDPLEPQEQGALLVVCVETEDERRALARVPSQSSRRTFAILGEGASLFALVFELEQELRHLERDGIDASASWGVEVPCPHVVRSPSFQTRSFHPGGGRRATAALLGVATSLIVAAAWLGTDARPGSSPSSEVPGAGDSSRRLEPEALVPMPADYPPPVLPLRRSDDISLSRASSNDAHPGD